jgi:hypothetical protein
VLFECHHLPNVISETLHVHFEDVDFILTHNGWQSPIPGSPSLFLEPPGMYTPDLALWGFPEHGDPKWISQARLAGTFIQAVEESLRDQFVVAYNDKAFALAARIEETGDSIPEIPPLWLTFALQRLRRMPKNVWERLMGKSII